MEKLFKTKRISKGILAFLAVYFFIFLSGCGLIPKEEGTLVPPLVKPKKQEYELYSVKKGSIEKSLKGLATFQPGKEQSLFFKESGARLKVIHVKAGDYVRKGDVLMESDTGDLSSRIKHVEFSLQKIILQTKKLQEDMAVDVTMSDYDLQVAKIEVQDTQLTLNDLKELYNRAKITSPFNGTVVYIDEIKEGDVIEAFKTVIQVADPKELQLVYAFTDVNRANEAKLGMKVNLKIGGKDYKGDIIMCPSSQPLDANPKLKNTLIIKVDKLSTGVKIGDFADFTIIIEKKENVLILPARGLRTYTIREYVEVFENGSKKELDIETGIRTATEVEIISGLKEGQQVILK